MEKDVRYTQNRRHAMTDDRIRRLLQSSSLYREALKTHFRYSLSYFVRDLDSEGRLQELSDDAGVSVEELRRFWQENWVPVP